MITQFSECVSNSQFVIIIIKFLLKGRDGKDRNWGMIPGFGCKVVINFGQYKVNVPTQYRNPTALVQKQLTAKILSALL